jgi:hypothetical protein
MDVTTKGISTWSPGVIFAKSFTVWLYSKHHWMNLLGGGGLVSCGFWSRIVLMYLLGMKKRLFAMFVTTLLMGCSDNSTGSNSGTSSSVNGSSNSAATVNQNQVLTGTIRGAAFTFVSGSYEITDDKLDITLYPAEPLPVADRLWSPWDHNLNLIMIPIRAEVGSYTIPYHLDPGSQTITAPTLFLYENMLNISASVGVVEIYSIDTTSGTVTGGFMTSDPEDGTALNGTFTVRELSLI